MRIRAVAQSWRRGRLVRFLRSVGRSLKLVAIFLYGGLELAIKRPKTRELRAEWLHRLSARAPFAR